MTIDSERVRRLVVNSLSEWRQPGLAIAITSPERTLYQAGFGVRRLGDGEAQPVDEKTIFGIGSCTKPFAAATIALLVDEGRLTWDDRVVEHLPDFRLHDAHTTRELTIRDLLCMRAGIASGEHRHRRACVDRADYLRRLRYHPPLHPLRAQYAYWTDGFTVLGELVERVTGRSWQELARARLWAPPGMNRTNADHRAAREDANSAAPHEVIDGRLRPIPWVYEDHVATPAGGMNASVADLTSWLQLMLGEGERGGLRVISAAAMREMRTPHTPIRGEFAEAEFAGVVGEGVAGIRFSSYALGWYVHDYRGHTVVYHTGKIDGFRSIMGFLPDLGIGISVLINSTHHLMQVGIFQAVVDLLLGEGGTDWSRAYLEHKKRLDFEAREAARALAARRTNGTSPSLPLARFAGGYADDGRFGRVTIAVEDDGLTLAAGEAKYSLSHWHDDVFELHRQGPCRLAREGFVRFRCDESGSVSGMQWPDGFEFERLGG